MRRTRFYQNGLQFLFRREQCHVCFHHCHINDAVFQASKRRFAKIVDLKLISVLWESATQGSGIFFEKQA